MIAAEGLASRPTRSRSAITSVVNPFKAPVIAPSGEPAVNRPPRGKVVRQQPPRAARSHDIEDAVDDLAHRPSARPARGAGLRQVRRDHAPLCIGQIGLVSGNWTAMLLSCGWRPHASCVVNPGAFHHDSSRLALNKPLD